MWPNPKIPADLVTFTEEILNGKLHFFCSAWSNNKALGISWKINTVFLVWLKLPMETLASRLHNTRKVHSYGFQNSFRVTAGIWKGDDNSSPGTKNIICANRRYYKLLLTYYRVLLTDIFYNYFRDNAFSFSTFSVAISFCVTY